MLTWQGAACDTVACARDFSCLLTYGFDSALSHQARLCNHFPSWSSRRERTIQTGTLAYTYVGHPTWSPDGLRIDWTGSLRRIPVPFDVDASLAVFERHLQNLIGQVCVGVQFVQHLGEELSLEGEVHTSRRIQADQPRME
jgi:hypothetical protein